MANTTATKPENTARTHPALLAYAAQTAAVRAAVKAGCGKCSGPVDHVQDFGSDFVECDACGWVLKIDANQPLGANLDRKAA